VVRNPDGLAVRRVLLAVRADDDVPVADHARDCPCACNRSYPRSRRVSS